ncbi:MAG TPA: hypothetical protein VF937_04115, partial [Chloroflexota bacterium]
MPERSGPRSSRVRQPGQRRSGRHSHAAPPGHGRGPAPGLRERLRRDPFLFTLCLGALAFVTWAFALTWWVTGG